ncbi:protease [Chitinimonas arctica]|uniref:Protease n=1 Tax=Chitinimonas arctica TaxID=2594795 RepID=A0A516SIW4_9NEIS|nr:protease [Chitinimonas arctica]QDQ28099.1 protease [Chitinimonas arctica]
MNLSSFARPLFAAGFFCVTLTVFSANQPAKPNAMLACQLLAPPPLPSGHAVMLGFRLRNTGKDTVWVLDWNTPLEGLRNRFLRIRGPAGELDYEGPMFKRGQPQLQQYRRIDAGQAIEAEIELTLAYDFSRPGKYRVEFTGHLHDMLKAPAQPPRGQAALVPQGLSCPAVEITVLPAVTG